MSWVGCYHFDPMLRRFLQLFKKATIAIPGAADLGPGEGRTVQVGNLLEGGTQILICRLMDGSVHALDTDCPHAEGGRLMAGPLAEGKFAVCPLHAFQFDPRNGAVERGTCRAARTFRISEADGQFLIQI